MCETCESDTILKRKDISLKITNDVSKLCHKIKRENLKNTAVIVGRYNFFQKKRKKKKKELKFQFQFRRTAYFSSLEIIEQIPTYCFTRHIILSLQAPLILFNFI